jgi:hypothetical protein
MQKFETLRQLLLEEAMSRKKEERGGKKCPL